MYRTALLRTSRALTLYRPVTQGPLFYEFLAVCNRGNLTDIRRFHDEQIRPDPPIMDPAAYARFMGTVYCILGASSNDSVTRWFQGIAAEIHRLH
jgi:hypothetical protein